MYALNFPFTKEPLKKMVHSKSALGKTQVKANTDDLSTDESVIWVQGYGFDAVTY